MNARRIILLIVLILLLFLGVYTWNQRTGKWDALGANVGLEFTGSILRTFHAMQDGISDVWNHYVSLMDVREENDRLKAELNAIEVKLASMEEDQRELTRIRSLLDMDYQQDWEKVGARILGWRMGSNSVLETFILSKGYWSGATTGTPVSAPRGLVGRVLKAGPSTSIALLVTDPGSSVSVISAEGRVQGVVRGEGSGRLLSLRFVKQNAPVRPGEILLTSGLDFAYPKGIPVARVVSVETGSHAMLEITALPLVNFEELEEVVLLQRPVRQVLPEGSPVYTIHTDSDYLSSSENQPDIDGTLAGVTP